MIAASNPSPIVQTDLSLDPKSDGLLVPVIIKIIPEYDDTEPDIQYVDAESDSRTSRPELLEPSDEEDRPKPVCLDCGQVHCLCKDHDDS